jgi:hypothetical protein
MHNVLLMRYKGRKPEATAQKELGHRGNWEEKQHFARLHHTFPTAQVPKKKQND